MNEELLNLYTEWTPKFKETVSKFPNENLHGPFLTSPGSLYQKQKTKLFVIGQESFKWHTQVDHPQVQMREYENFIRSNESKSSPYWNIISKIEKFLGNERFSCLTTNINKFDVNGIRPNGIHLEVISKLDKILIDEIHITKPDVCIFFTGPEFDYRIESIFNGIEFVEIPGFSVGQVCLLKHPELPKHTYRSYHPNKLRFSKLEPDFLEVLEKLLLKYS